MSNSICHSKAIEHPTKKSETILNPGDQLKFNAQSGTDPLIGTFSSGDSPSWKNGNSRFSGSNILLVVEPGKYGS